ncbi:hypothetical protein JCM8202_006187 [Rhodotorula sphaerocarpa]
MVRSLASRILAGAYLLLVGAVLGAAVAAAVPDPVGNASSTLVDSSAGLVPRAPSVPRYRRCKQSGQLALTFDDGPYLGASTATLLEKYGGRGTYFVNGYNWGCIYESSHAEDLLRHVDITTLTTDQLHRQLDLLETALWKILGVKPRFFRPPYGRYDQKSLQVLNDRGYIVVLWDFDDRDTLGDTPAQSIAGYKKLAMTYPRPHIALNHETQQSTVDVVIPAVVPLLRQQGYRLVGMDQCLAQNPYQAVGTPQARDSTWTCAGKPGPGQP